MNKLFIVLLAVCLVSVHAFVKRDAPEAAKNENYLETLQKQLEDISKQINDKVTSALAPEQLKKNFGEVVDNLNKALEDIKTKTAAPKN